MNMHAPAPRVADYEKINSRLNKSWTSADYSQIGIRLQIVGEMLAEAADISPGSKVLDVAAGNGNATLAFAKRWCEVVSTDYVDSFLDHGRIRAAAEGLDVTFQTADAQNLPFEEASFDGVVSTFGVMFAPDQPKSAAELLRVCRPGGKIALANHQNVVIAQIETERGLENVDAIAAIPGIDVLWVGHFDLANFLGIPGQFQNPVFLDAVQAVVDAARRHGKGLGFMPADANWAAEYKGYGFNMLAVGTDHGLLMQGVSGVLQTVREA